MSFFKGPRRRRRRPFFLFMRTRRHGSGFVILIFLALSVLVSMLFIDTNISPLIRTMGLAQAQQIASRVIHGGINSFLSEETLSYDDLIILEKDDSGRITALKTDISNINQLKSSMAVLILEELNKIESEEIGIPLGNIISGELLSGRGPQIPIRLLPVGAVNTEIENHFSTAGINQTLHQIYMTVTTYVTLILPGDNVSTEVSVTVNIAETIIVGAVPDAYTNVNGDEESTIGRINDYSAN